ncbi:hypothetical protein D3C85_849360 [compost metagenome]
MPPRLLQRIQQRQPLGIFQRMLRDFCARLRNRPRLTNHRRQVLQPDSSFLAQCRQRPQHIAQLPHVARPGKPQQCLARRRVDQYRFSVGFFGQQKIEQLRFVTAIAQRRQRDFQAIEAVIQILAEAAVLHPLQQIAVRGADDPHVD